MNGASANFIEWLREEYQKDPASAIRHLELAEEEEALVIVMDVLDDIAEAYREEYPDVAKKAIQLRTRLNDMRWPSLATGYPVGKALREQGIDQQSAATDLRHARRRKTQTQPTAAETAG